MSAEAAERAGVRALAEIRTHGNVTGRTTRCTPSRPTPIRQAPAKAGRTISDLDLIEINEAFAIVAIQAMRDLNVGHDEVNVNGGAIALSYPLGACGARIALHLCYELPGPVARRIHHRIHRRRHTDPPQGQRQDQSGRHRQAPGPAPPARHGHRT
ncbi:MAG: hypothetical protein WAL72_11860 [Streptosporangiaceae bacterium]